MNKRLLYACGAALTLCFAPNLRAESSDEKYFAEHPLHLISLEVEDLQIKAEAGSARAQFKLAEMYEHGDGGLAQSEAYALSWYEESARNGNTSARERLRVLGSVD